MRSLQFTVFFGEDDRPSQASFFLKILFVNSSFGEVGFDVVELAEVSAT